jgi:hypothetical protein
MRSAGAAIAEQDDELTEGSPLCDHESIDGAQEIGEQTETHGVGVTIEALVTSKKLGQKAVC